MYLMDYSNSMRRKYKAAKNNAHHAKCFVQRREATALEMVIMTCTNASINTCQWEEKFGLNLANIRFL